MNADDDKAMLQALRPAIFKTAWGDDAPEGVTVDHGAAAFADAILAAIRPLIQEREIAAHNAGIEAAAAKAKSWARDRSHSLHGLNLHEGIAADEISTAILELKR